MTSILQRKCPDCKKKIFYSGTWQCTRANNKNSLCVSCTHIGKPKSKLHARHISEGKTGKKRKPFSKEWKLKIGLAMKNRTVSYRTRKKLRLINLGRKLSANHKKKIRLSKINLLKKKYGVVFPGYNPNACKIIEKYAKRHGYNFQHALNGGEFFIDRLGYWVDGYDKEKNVVVEYYEPHHFRRTQQRKKDKQRMNEIISHLKCKFIVLAGNGEEIDVKSHG